MGVILVFILGVVLYKGIVFKFWSLEDVLNMLNMLCKGGGFIGIKNIKELFLYLLYI